MNRAIMICFAAAAAISIATPSQAGLVISEVLFNEVGSDTGGEWIEIFNTGPAAIDLTNYKIGDEETSGATGSGESVFQFPSGANIAPGAVQIVASSALRFNEVYGFLPTYELQGTVGAVAQMSVYAAWDPDGGLINMANTNDQALLLDGADNVVDGVNWGNNTYLNPGLPQPVADGRSYERINAYIDTNTAADWQLGPDSAVAAQRSTPGVVPVPEPASTLLLVVGASAIGLAARRQ